MRKIKKQLTAEQQIVLDILRDDGKEPEHLNHMLNLICAVDQYRRQHNIKICHDELHRAAMCIVDRLHKIEQV